MSDASTSPSERGHRAVALLVGQALDDLESERIDLATALQLVVERAWSEGHRAGLAAVGPPEPHFRPLPSHRTNNGGRRN